MCQTYNVLREKGKIVSLAVGRLTKGARSWLVQILGPQLSIFPIFIVNFDRTVGSHEWPRLIDMNSIDISSVELGKLECQSKSVQFLGPMRIPLPIFVFLPRDEIRYPLEYYFLEQKYHRKNRQKLVDLRQCNFSLFQLKPHLKMDETLQNGI